MFPIDAAVIPLPSEETTPPVTKTYFDIDDLQGGFSNLTGSGPAVNISPRLTGLTPLSRTLSPRGRGRARPSVRPLAPGRRPWSRTLPTRPGRSAWAGVRPPSGPSP